MSTTGKTKKDVRTRRAILDMLKGEGPQDAAAMASRLGITPMAVRQHLYGLRDEGLVESDSSPDTGNGRRSHRGRPAKMWRLTEAANRYFPDAHAGLTTEIIDAMRAALDEDNFSKVLAARARAQKKAYRAELKTVDEIGPRLKALADIRTREGYMCDSTADGNGWLLVEKHCPICVAASACQGLCQTELDLFSAIVGKSWNVERVDHIVAGATRCTYQITPKNKQK